MTANMHLFYTFFFLCFCLFSSENDELLARSLRVRIEVATFLW